MQSVFFPDSNINSKFDIKGCWAGRYQAPEKNKIPSEMVFKDQNFYGEYLLLGEDKNWFLKQVRSQLYFLSQVEV